MFPWFSAVMLTLDAARVINVRFQMMVLGTASTDEMFLMVTEKLGAMHEAGAIIINGGYPAEVIDSYRNIVAANVARLSA